jgi:glyoxylase-like metal-dependent hydrolase (beta-lactamase superfamily II)
MQFATGRYMRHAMLAQPFEMEDVCGIVRLNFGRRVMLHAGPHELAPGIMLIPTGGHSGGLQFVRVHTERGWVVVASDVTHYYDNIAMGRPFTIAFHVGDMLEGYDAVLAAASSPAHVIPGHDPKVMEIYPAPRPDLAGIVARLDVAPSADPIRDLRAQ